MKRFPFCIPTTLAVLAIATAGWAASPTLVGPHPSGGTMVATGQLVRPAGRSVEFNGRPVDLVLSRDGKTLMVKDNQGLVMIDTATWKILQRTSFPQGGGSMHGLTFTKDGTSVYATTAGNALWEAKIAAGGVFTWARSITLPGPGGNMNSAACLWGIALSPDEKTACVCLSRNNSLAVVDLESGKLKKEIPTGVAPYDVVLSADGTRAYVSNWGGRHPRKGEHTGKSAGTDTLVDARGVACSGTVSLVDLTQGREVSETPVGLHPADMQTSPDGRLLYAANANSDTVSVLDTRTMKVVETILVRPDPTLPFGSASNALTISPDGRTLYVANGGNNAVAVVALRGGKRARSVVQGFIPTAWYPGALALHGNSLYVANVIGLGSRWPKEKGKGWDIYRPMGVVSKVPLPAPQTLRKYTAQVRADSRVPQILRAREKAISGRKPVPVPEHLGEPSVFEHVVYVVKENKTYDQMFGDLPRGNNDPALCIYGREVSPNHHALAEQFVQLDNYYCNGVCSAEGHSWVTEGNVTDHLQKSYGGFARSYSFGDDTLTYSSTGLIWDNVLAHGLSFRNYGEFDTATPTPNASWTEIYKDRMTGAGKIKFQQDIGNEVIRRYSCPDCPGWNLNIPDAVRADAFLREFREYEKKGGWPNFVIIYLPTDHTSGGAPGVPTPRAQVADNDLALGRVVEAISKSRYWAKTCIFVEEDDPQSGFDHVDGHRSLCLVVSPYTKRGALVSQFYNQTAVLHTMERIMGIPPMNQMDAMSPLMTECFTSKPNLTPYTCLPNRIPLDEMPKATGYYYGKDRGISPAELQAAFAKPDQINDDELNRAMWYNARGLDTPYPAHLAGAHGTGLEALHLALSPDGDVDGDD